MIKESDFLITSFSLKEEEDILLSNFHVEHSTLTHYTHSKKGTAALKHSDTGRGPSEETRSIDPGRLPSRR